MISRFALIFIALIALFTVTNTSCKKEKILTSGGELKFSADTLNFDTVFTSLGSFTVQVKIYNPQSQKVNISSVRLEKGNGSYFHINVNGIEGNAATNIELEAKDSMYVFATVNIDPTNQNTPFIIEDKLIATMNGKDYVLPLMAYGQNAYYIVDSVLSTQTWKTDKPYVIIKNALVDEGQTLTIPAGCRIYVHADSRLFVDGRLLAIGTKKDSIIFQGDRLDRKYFGNEGYPGEWGGLYFTTSSTNNILEWVVLRNCGGSTKLGQSAFSPAAIQLTPDTINDTKVQLTMRYSIIENSIGYGILGFGSTMLAENCLINSCGAQALATFEGGGYLFNNCDFITYGNNKVSHTDNPTVAIINYRDIDDVSYVAGPLFAEFNNCVIWGSLKTECFINKRGSDTFSVKMNNCFAKREDAIPAYVQQSNCNIVDDPQFVNSAGFNFRLQGNSPLKDKGIVVTGIDRDLDDKPRSDGKPDIGCYEY